MAGWKIQGQYMETCNCTFVCPCITSNLTETPTEGECKAAVAMKIDKGEKDGVVLDGVAFVVLMHSPQAMAEGDITVGLIVDDGATEEQVQAIRDIATGAAGGPMAALAPLVTNMAGIERQPISFEAEGMDRRVKAGELVDQACAGVESAVDPDQPVFLENTCHPVNARLALAQATHSRFHAFGIEWNDRSGTRNGHFAPFTWAG